MMEGLFRRQQDRSGEQRRERRVGHCDYLCAISFLGLEFCCLSTMPRFGFTPFFEKVFIQEREKKGISMF